MVIIDDTRITYGIPRFDYLDQAMKLIILVYGLLIVHICLFLEIASSRIMFIFLSEIGPVD